MASLGGSSTATEDMDHMTPAEVFRLSLPRFAEPDLSSSHGSVYDVVGSVLTLLRSKGEAQEAYRQFFMDTMLVIQDLANMCSKSRSDISTLECFRKSLNHPSLLGDILESMPDEEEKKKLSRILSYITHLIQFKVSMDGSSSAEAHEIPPSIKDKFSGTNRSDLLIRYVLVLTLHADDFQTDMTSDIATDLKMHRGALRNHYEILGCKLGF